MSTRQYKRPNACKHGGYAKSAILPGEDPEEFAALLSALIEEWMPVGVTEQDAVVTLATAIWSKRRAERFLEAAILKNMIDPLHPSYDEALGLRSFARLLAHDPEAFGKYAPLCLRADKTDELSKEFPPQDFESTEGQAKAIVSHIKSVLLPEARFEGAREAADAMALSLSAATVAGDCFRQHIALLERLNAEIDRAIKRLIHIKGVKQMLSQTG